MKPPKATHAPDPKFPDLPSDAEPRGTVVMLVGVNAKGRVEAVRVLRSDEHAFETSAVNTVKKWKFRPAEKNGQAVPVQVTVEMKFREVIKGWIVTAVWRLRWSGPAAVGQVRPIRSQLNIARRDRSLVLPRAYTRQHCNYTKGALHACLEWRSPPATYSPSPKQLGNTSHLSYRHPDQSLQRAMLVLPYEEI